MYWFYNIIVFPIFFFFVCEHFLGSELRPKVLFDSSEYQIFYQIDTLK